MVLYRYLVSLGVTVLVTLVGVVARGFIHPANLVMLYLMGVVICALFLGRGPAILASLLSVLVFDFFLVEPRLSLTVADAEYLLTFAGLLVVGLVISSLTSQVREQVNALQLREAQTRALNELSRDLTAAIDLDTMLHAVVEHTSHSLNGSVVILIPTASQDFQWQTVASPGYALSEDELAAVQAAYRDSQPSGQGTGRHTQAASYFVPLQTAQGVVGVMGIRFESQRHALKTGQHHQLEGFSHLAALAIERARLSEQVNQARVLNETEKLQAALLNSISHDLRTPLVSIQGVLDDLHEETASGGNALSLEPGERLDMIQNAREETARLNRIVENLLEMTRLEAGALKMRQEPTDVQDIIGSALARVDEPLRDHPVLVHLEEDLPLVFVDFILVEQVLINLLDNAAKYSPPGAPIEISARSAAGQVCLSVADRGMGIPPDALENIFQKFSRRSPADTTQGIGLGLSICKGIVEAHTGRIWAENRPKGGAVLTLALPQFQPSHAEARKND